MVPTKLLLFIGIHRNVLRYAFPTMSFANHRTKEPILAPPHFTLNTMMATLFDVAGAMTTT